MSKYEFNVLENVNPTFEEVWVSEKPYNVLKGGRNSFKSSVIVLKLAMLMVDAILENDKIEIVVIRKVAKTIRDSVFAKVWWALHKVGIGGQFEQRVSPYKIIHKRTGSTFHFYGQDDFAKLKSNEVGNVVAVWYEEAAEFTNSEEFDQSNSTFMRQKHPDYPYVQFFWSYNPPRNPYNWINEWKDQLEDDKNYLVHSSSYKDDRLHFVTDQMLAEIERIKKNDYDYYRYLYLGESVGLGTNVYNYRLFNQIDKLDDKDKIKYLYFAMDSGHQQSATTCLAVALTFDGKVIVLDNYYYSPAGVVNKKAPSQLTKDIEEFVEKWKKRITSMPNGRMAVLRKYTIDSAEGALRNEYYLACGIRWNPVAKKKKIVMTEYVQSLLAQGRVYVLTTSENNVKYFLEEHKVYRWEEKTINTDDPKVVKDDDHTCDAFQYLVIDNAKDFNLKV